MSDEALIEAMARWIAPVLGTPWPVASDTTKRNCRKMATAALAEIRKTHAVVPREPSETIRRAGYSAIYGITRHDIVPSLVAERAVEAYRAMLNASEATDA